MDAPIKGGPIAGNDRSARTKYSATPYIFERAALKKLDFIKIGMPRRPFRTAAGFLRRPLHRQDIRFRLSLYTVLMRRPFAPSRIHMRSGAHSRRRSRDRRTPVGTILGDTTRNAAIERERRPFWQRIARALDRLTAQRSRRAVPVTVRQCRNDIRRCHRLISQVSPIAVSGGNRSDVMFHRRTNSANRS
jgi:hypothetical protein